MTFAEAQVVSRIAFLAWEHREEELREETKKLYVAASITATEVERYERERIDRERYWQTKLIASEIERDDLRDQVARLKSVLKATSEAERCAKLALTGYRSHVAGLRKSRAELDALEAEKIAVVCALDTTNGNKTAAARLLGLCPGTLENRLMSGTEPSPEAKEVA